VEDIVFVGLLFWLSDCLFMLYNINVYSVFNFLFWEIRPSCK